MSGNALSSARFHLVAAIVGVAVVSVLAGGGTRARLQNGNGVTAEIAVEHARPIELSFAVSTKGGAGIVELAVTGEDETFVSVPEHWIRREVRGVPLAHVTAEPAALGFVRWKFPESAVVGFRMEDAPGSLLLFNPSRVPVKVSVSFIDLDTGDSARDVVLVQDEKVTVWKR